MAGFKSTLDNAGKISELEDTAHYLKRWQKTVKKSLKGLQDNVKRSEIQVNEVPKKRTKISFEGISDIFPQNS